MASTSRYESGNGIIRIGVRGTAAESTTNTASTTTTIGNISIVSNIASATTSIPTNAVVAISQQNNFTSVAIAAAAASNHSQYNNSNVDIPQIPSYIRTTSMVFCVIIMILGLIGNIMVPIVILKTKDMRNSTNIFLTNLSIADLLVLLICTPTVLVEVNTRPDTWILGKKMCKAVPFIELTVAHASVLTILAISFERYYAICEPLKAGYVCTKTRALLICVFAWGIAAVFTSPILWIAEYKYEEYIDGSLVPVCLTQAVSTWAIGFFLMTISLFFILPLTVLIILYGIIAKNLISNDGPMMKIRPTKPEFSLKARKQVVLMLGAVVLSFFLCLLPFRALTVWIILSSQQSFLALGIEKYYNLLYFCRIMLYLNSAINPILYNLMSTKFRKGFIKLSSICCTGFAAICYNNRLRPMTSTMKMSAGSNNNTNTTTSSSLSFLSRSSNRRTNSDIKNGSRHQSKRPSSYIMESEVIDAEREVVLPPSLTRGKTLEESIIDEEAKPPISSKSKPDTLDDHFKTKQKLKILNYRIKCKRQISFDETIIVRENRSGDDVVCGVTAASQDKMLQHKSFDNDTSLEKTLNSELRPITEPEPKTNIRIFENGD